jgi:succinoglycan biosynthesis protein ExoA
MLRVVPQTCSVESASGPARLPEDEEYMLVSLLIPCYQERAFIEACLTSVRSFELASDVELEILVLDGMSTDGTRDIVNSFARRDPRISLVDNPRRIQSTALNIGIRRARGELIVRLDVHSNYPSNYLRLCIETSGRTGADNVGGVASTLPRGAGYEASLVQALTTHRFGVGDSGFRVGAAEGPSDTVPYGCFRRQTFERVGGFDERLVRAQDYEMNRRIANAGGVIWLNPAIQLQYYQQPTLRAFFRKQIEHEAPYNAYLWYVAPYAFAPRHAVTGVFAFGVLAGVLLSPLVSWIEVAFLVTMTAYAFLAVISAVQQAMRYRRLRHVLFLPFCFFGYHFLHGLGVLYGLARLATRTAPVQRAILTSLAGESAT